MNEQLAAHNLADQTDNLLQTLTKCLRYLNTQAHMHSESHAI